jgi:hypothetical protein
MLDITNPEKIRRKFEKDIQRKLREIDTIDEETVFTWSWSGETAFFLQFTATSWQFCTREHAQIQVGYAPSFLQHVQAIRTATGRVETSPLSKIQLSHILRLSFWPFGNGRLGITATIHVSNVQSQPVAALASGAGGSEDSDADQPKEEGRDTVNDSSEDDDADDGDDELTFEVDQHTKARLKWGSSIHFEIQLVPYSGTAAMVTLIATTVAEVIVDNIRAVLIDSFPDDEDIPKSKDDRKKNHKFGRFVVNAGKSLLSVLAHNPITVAYVTGAIVLRFGNLKGFLKLFINVMLPNPDNPRFQLSMALALEHYIGGAGWTALTTFHDIAGDFIPFGPMRAAKGVVFDISAFYMLAACPEDGVSRLSFVGKSKRKDDNDKNESVDLPTITSVLAPINETKFELFAGSNISDGESNATSPSRKHHFWSRRRRSNAVNDDL